MLRTIKDVPYVDALYGAGASKTSGRTAPVQLSCVGTDGETRDYIVKLRGHPEIQNALGVHHLAREVYGSLLAQTFGIDTPEIAIVNLDGEFYQSQPLETAKLLRDSAGLNFGSQSIKEPKIVRFPETTKMPSAARIFCFDMFIGNSDRRIDKPNAFHTLDGYMVFDHEQAFPFSKPAMFLGGPKPGWEDIKTGWPQNHIFYKLLKCSECILYIEEFIGDLADLSDEILVTIEEQIPEDWLTGTDIKNITYYLANTRDHINLFKRSLQEILA